ncbi:relaxase/mobilization nuclease domain-containing protein [Sphingomonas kyungheensis]|uniref:Relaxase/mobilization nuclease domain-containing protein n=1 Tax=Sphingomonas kyungheensis TaxID=1069987 RepID=A0ABU8H747_9SPHN
MSFRLSPGTLDSLAGVFAPPRKRRSRGGGRGKGGARDDGAMLAFAAASLLRKTAPTSSSYRPSAQVKQAFGGGSHAAISARALRTMERTARRVPEVMVRVTGRQHGGGHVLANMSYISRLGHGEDKQIDLHTSEGEVLRDGRDMQELAQDWQEWETADEARRKGATSLSMILSMPAHTDPQGVKEAALAFAREEFANRSWVAALHVDRDHPHVHLTVARRDYDGRRFNPDSDDLLRYRQRFAQKLRDRGIEANATPVQARGVDAKHEPIAARKIREQGAVPQIDRNRADRARRLHENGRADPAVTALAKRQAVVRDTFQRSIDELLTSPSLVDQVKAQSLKTFVAAMPEPVPNSMRATQIDRGADAQSAAASAPEKGIAAADPVAAALARLEAATAEITARRAREAMAANPVTLALARMEAAKAEIEKRHQQEAGAADPLAATLARINEAAKVRTAPVQETGEVEMPGSDQSADRAAAKPGRDRPAERDADDQSQQMRPPLEPESRPMPTLSADQADAILRQTLERVRAQQQEREQMRQRDRSQDRGGPRR